MITTVSLLYDLDMKLNKIATNKHQSIELENKIIALNEAQIQLIKQKIDPNNVLGLGFDAFKKRYDDLQALVVPEEQVTVTKDPNSKLFKYLIDTSTFKHNYMFYVDLYCIGDNGKCSDWQLFTYKVKHADLQKVLGNNNTNPSFEYQEIPLTISSKNIEVYADATFTINSGYVSYLRYPIPVDFEGYIHFDGTESTTVNCELPFYLKDELVDLAVEELAMDTGNAEVVTYTQSRKQNNE